MEKWQGKKIAILGFGIAGIAVAKYLLSSGIEKISILDRSSSEEILSKIEDDSERWEVEELLNNEKIEKIFGEGYLADITGFDVIVRSPGISFNNGKIQEALNAGKEITSQIRMFFDLCPAKIIGITGTKGKGTTSSLIYEILRKKSEILNPKSEINSNFSNSNGQNVSDLELRASNFQQVYLAGNIGYPALTLLPEIKPEDFVILELSSFQLMDLHKSPHIAVVTNLTVDHLDYHCDIKEYQNAKKNILKFQNENDFAIINADSTFDSNFLNELKSNIQFFSRQLDGTEASVKEDKVVLNKNGEEIEICEMGEINLFGQHNLDNIAAASLVANILNVDMEVIRNAVKDFLGLPHRLEFVEEINGIKFINDSFATNPEPTIAAINSFSQDKILILGGSSKGADFSGLAHEIVNNNVAAVCLIGVEAQKIKSSLENYEFKGEVFEGFSDLLEVVKKILEIGKNGDVAIFSPACASFDMFKNYKQRGDKFKEIVQKVKEANA